MFFYNFDDLDVFINNSLEKSIVDEKNRIDNIINLYENKKENLFNITTNMISITNTISDNKLDNFYETSSCLKKALESLENIESCAKILKSTLNDITFLYEKSVENNFNEIKADLIEYNKQDEKLNNQISDYENGISSILNNAVELLVPNTAFNFINSKDIETVDKTIDNNVLIVSEKDQKAYLPYKYSTVQKIYESSKDKYSSIEDVVRKLYILPLSRFKNSSFSRFREAFNLVRLKEKGSVTKALDLGLELIFHYDLNPIVIAACRNLDELDIYLDCLDSNELDDFDCFEIRFEMAPRISK